MGEIKRAVLFVDGDNVSGKTADAIYAAAAEYGEICEAHLFANFKTADNEWNISAYKYAMQKHHMPVIVPKKNTSDIGLTIRAVETLYSNPDYDVYIIVTNDTDFMPLATKIRNCGKKAVCLYTNVKSKKTAIAFDEHKLVKTAETAKPEKGENSMENFAETVATEIEKLLSLNTKTGKVPLQSVGASLKKAGVDYPQYYGGEITGLAKLLQKLIDDYPATFANIRTEMKNTTQYFMYK